MLGGKWIGAPATQPSKSASGLLVLLVVCLTASNAAADPMVVQPDGKIVVAGKTWPEAGAVARLLPDGGLDSSFGEGGFVVDHRLSGFRALALQPDGDIVGAAVGGFQLARYLPDGTSDPGFAGGGVGGTNEPDQVHFIYGDYGPSAVLVRADGVIVVGGIHEVNGGGATEGLVKAYDVSGRLLETIGRVPLPGGPASAATLYDILEEPNGFFIGAGSSYTAEPPHEARPLLARFVPGSGADFDPTFGGGVGLVLPPFPSRCCFRENRLTALATSGGKLMATGQAAGTFLLARFNSDGSLDTSFGEGGFVAPKIEGPGDTASGGAASTWANDLAVISGGGAVLGGGTSQWGKWSWQRDWGVNCSDCPQPMLARFDSSGHLDPGFGSGGLLRLVKPDGDTFVGDIEQVTSLSNGKLLVEGKMPNVTHPDVPFVARLNADGSYDPSFGENGLVTLQFPCTDQPEKQRRRAGCFAVERLKLHLVGVRSGHPAMFLKLRPSVSWVGLGSVTLFLPRRLRLTRSFRSKLKVWTVGAAAGKIKVEMVRPKRHPYHVNLLISGLDSARLVSLRIRHGGLRLVGFHHHPHPRLTLKIGAAFIDRRSGTYAGRQAVVRRVG